MLELAEGNVLEEEDEEDKEDEEEEFIVLTFEVELTTAEVIIVAVALDVLEEGEVTGIDDGVIGEVVSDGDCSYILRLELFSATGDVLGVFDVFKTFS